MLEHNEDHKYMMKEVQLNLSERKDAMSLSGFSFLLRR